MTTDTTITLPDSSEAIQARVDKLRHTNSVILKELSQLGAGVDFFGAMVTTYFETMVALELITEDQWLDMQLTWEQRFNTHLTQMQARVQDAVEKQAVRQRLIVPGR